MLKSARLANNKLILNHTGFEQNNIGFAQTYSYYKTVVVIQEEPNKVLETYNVVSKENKIELDVEQSIIDTFNKKGYIFVKIAFWAKNKDGDIKTTDFSNNFVIYSFSPSLSTFSISPTSISANDSSVCTLTLVLIDIDSNLRVGEEVKFSASYGVLSEVIDKKTGAYTSTIKYSSLSVATLTRTVTLKVDSVNGSDFPMASKTLTLTRNFITIAHSNSVTIPASEVATQLNNQESINYRSADGNWVEKITLPSGVSLGRAVKVTVESTYATDIVYNSTTLSGTAGNIYTFIYNGSIWVKQ